MARRRPRCTALDRRPWPGIVCMHGEAAIGWPRVATRAHCHRCLVFVTDALARFHAAVQRGDMDADGFTPHDRKMQAKRAAR